MKTILFTPVFLKGHPFAGQPTNFAEKIAWNIKIHTIRAGNNWKVGDVFEPRQWQGRPYHSKQEAIGPPRKVIAVYDVLRYDGFWRIQLKTSSPGQHPSFSVLPANQLLYDLSKNDGLRLDQFLPWFSDRFEGQIIIWENPKGDPYAHLFNN